MDFSRYKKICEKHFPDKNFGVDKDGKFFVEGEKDVDVESLWKSMKKEVFMEEIREERNKLLDESDKYVASDWEHPEKEKYKTYRQELRDLPAKYEALMSSIYDYKDKVLTKRGVEHNFFPTI
jgi:rRNA maturation endonuclease Nob1